MQQKTKPEHGRPGLNLFPFLSWFIGKEGDRDSNSFTGFQLEVRWKGGDVKTDAHSWYTQPI
jgi:hypothetical protein